MSDAVIDRLVQLATPIFGVPTGAVRLLSHASSRVLVRLTFSGSLKKSVIGVFGPDTEENERFIRYSRFFHKNGLPVPEIYCVNESGEYYLEEDFGDVTLFEFLQEKRGGVAGGPLPSEVRGYYERALTILPQFQLQERASLNDALCLQNRSYNFAGFRSDLLYFRDEFLVRLGVPFDSAALDSEFNELVDSVKDLTTDYFFYRDFQARNIMIHEGELRFLDYQSGFFGPLHADVASLLYQVQAHLPEEERESLLEVYLDAVSEKISIDRAQFAREFPLIVLLRFFQVFGAYGKLGLGEDKPYFRDGIPTLAKTAYQYFVRHGERFGAPGIKGLLRDVCERAGVDAL